MSVHISQKESVFLVSFDDDNKLYEVSEAELLPFIKSYFKKYDWKQGVDSDLNTFYSLDLRNRRYLIQHRLKADVICWRVTSTDEDFSPLLFDNIDDAKRACEKYERSWSRPKTV